MEHRLVLVSVSALISLFASWSASRGVKARRSRPAQEFYGVYPSKRPQLFLSMLIVNVIVALMLWLGTAMTLLRLVEEI